MSILYHITTPVDWQAAQAAGRYTPASLAAEGFIHCSTRAQVAGSANLHFAGQHGLILLAIDPDRVTAPIRYEDLYHSGKQFPHIYGALPLEAVTGVEPFEPDEQGKFSELGD